MNDSEDLRSRAEDAIFLVLKGLESATGKVIDSVFVDYRHQQHRCHIAINFANDEYDQGDRDA